MISIRNARSYVPESASGGVRVTVTVTVTVRGLAQTDIQMFVACGRPLHMDLRSLFWPHIFCTIH